MRFIIFIFLLLVFLNLGIIFINNLSSYLPSLPSMAANPNQLQSVDLSLFAKDGTGRSFITQGYGRTPYSYRYPGSWHDGIDIAASYGAPIYSPSDGIVLATGNQDNFCYRRAFGKYVAVKDVTNGLVLWYAHLGGIDVAPGQTILKHAKIGTVGTTGLETGPHLHFSIFRADGFSMTPRNGCGPQPTGKDLNPLSYLGSTY